MNQPNELMRGGIDITHGVNINKDGGININIKPLEVSKTDKKHRVTNKDISSYLIKSKHKDTLKDRIKAHLLNNKTVKKIYRKKKKSHKNTKTQNQTKTQKHKNTRNT
jgi:hypothetical protein